MRSRHCALGLSIVTLLVALGGCRRADDQRRASADGNTPPSSPASASLAANSGEGLTITTTDGGVSMSLVRDSIAIHLSKATLSKAHADIDKDMDTTADKFGGLGAFITKTVKSTVGKALAFSVAVPISDVNDARYEDGRIELDVRNKPRINFDNVKSSNRPLLESFSPEDSRRFVAAVRKAKGLD